MNDLTIIRVKKDTNYSVVYNECFKNDKLSARAKGIFAYLLTLPDNWKIHKKELQTHFTEGRDAFNTAFFELEEAGYVAKTPRRNGSLMNGWDYTVYESIRVSSDSETGQHGEPATTKYLSLLNTESTKGASAHDAQILGNEKEPKQSKPFSPPTQEAVRRWAEGWAAEKHKDVGKVVAAALEGLKYYERNNWHDSTGKPVRNWKSKIVCVWFKDDRIGAEVVSKRMYL